MKPSQGTASDFQDTFELRKILAMILEKLWIVVVVVILAVAGGLVYLKMAVPIYQAQATVEVLVNNRNPAGMEIQGVNTGSAEALATVEANFHSRTLFQKVMERDEVATHPKLGLPADLSLIAQALQMEDWTRVQLRRGTRLIDIAVEHPSPEVAKLLANGSVEEYILERARIELGSSRSDFEMLLGEQKEIDGRLEALEAAQQSIDKVVESKNAITEREAEIALLRQTKGPLHPEVKAASSQLEAMYDELEGLVAKAQATSGGIGDKEAKTPVETGGNMSQQQRILAAADVLDLRLRSILRDIDSERVLREVIVARLKEAEITKDVQTSTIALVEPAFAPLEPVRPKAIHVMVLSVMLGGSLGLGAIWGLFALNSTLATVEEAERATGLPVIGLFPADKRLPNHAWLAKNKNRDIASLKQQFATDGSDKMAVDARFRRSGKGGKIEPLVLLSDPSSAVAESFRTLRANLALRAREQGLRSCLVVSAMPGEGKSFVAANLAVAVAAQASKRTLLIDADLRRPTMHVLFDVESGSAGLSEVLRDESSEPESFVLPSGIPNLDILHAGHGARNPAELLSSPNLAKVLEKFGEMYERIVIDAAPVNAVADGLLLAPLVDSVVLVARAGRTRREAVVHAAQMLSDADCSPIGLILNHVEKHSSDSSNPYTSKDYRMFQKYGENYG